MAASEHNGSQVNYLKVQVRTGTNNKSSPRLRRETHGRGDGIDVNTPVSEFKGASIFDRAKDELEAFVETIHPKKDYDYFVSPPKKDDGGGFRASIGKTLEKLSPTKNHNHQD